MYFLFSHFTPDLCPDVSLSMKMCARRKAGRRQRTKALRLPSVLFPWSLAVHHRSLAFRTRLYHAKNEAPEEEEADFRPRDVTPRLEPMTSWAPTHVQTLSQPHSSSRGRELIRDILGTSLPLVSTCDRERKRLVCRDEQNLY